MDFRQIAPRLGGKREAFEELCCQLARRAVGGDASYTRLHGAGGDGGVECFADLPSIGRVGWQAKYVFRVGPLLAQATRSLDRALEIHPTLTKYAVCFPFDLTGPTGRAGRSGQEKFDDWRQTQKQNALAKGRHLTIEAWPASKLRELLLEHDASGGLRRFFFDQTILTHEWFSEHLALAKKTAGPRYTPELNVETDLWKWFIAFGRSTVWSSELGAKTRACRKQQEHLVSALQTARRDSASPEWPEGLRNDTQALILEMGVLWDECDRLAANGDVDTYKRCVSSLGDLLDGLRHLESRLAADLEAQHGPGKADSPGFRQFMAEYMCAFPTVNVDRTREAMAAIRELHDWLCSPASSLVCVPAFVLSGVAGSGKTHGVCDAAERRFSEGFLTCVTFGHQFRGEPDPWTRLLEILDLPPALGMNGLLDVLNAAGEACGSPLILCIDAINETRPLCYWRDRLASVAHAFERRPYVRLCVTCRSSFIPYCLPHRYELAIVEHAGFAGVERCACQSFFEHYELDPPIAPILQPEFSNPLYLRLLCETLRSSGLRRVPLGWHGIARTIRAFLDEKERQFAAEHETSTGAGIVSGCLTAISQAIADSGDSALPWSEAYRVSSKARPQCTDIPVLEWLIRSDLLVEDAPVGTDAVSEESVLRPAFERLGDFLIAAALLEGCKESGLDAACGPTGGLHALAKDSEAIEQNAGLLSALSVIVPEYSPGLELPELFDNELVRCQLLAITVRSFPSRDPGGLTTASEYLLREALASNELSFDAMDAALAISWQPSAVDAVWLDSLLRGLPLAKRDAYWCGYLHDRFESRGTARRLIDAAFELPLDGLEPQIAERWATVLLWFTAAADRRVKDESTRATVALLSAKPTVIPDVLDRFMGCDDDEVRERVLLSSYGALIASRDGRTISLVTSTLQEAYRRNPTAFDNALIRDHIRCITELSQTLNVLPKDCDPGLTTQPIASDWPLTLPADDAIKRWDDLPKLAHSCLEDDFFVYSMGCLGPWQDGFPKESMGKWILQRVARDFGYQGSGCERYDQFMLAKKGGGRGKPAWAERVGKKYQWIAMYQLASRLHDHVARKRANWEPQLLRPPLVLLEERKLDPTLSPNILRADRETNAWWAGPPVDFQSSEELSDEEWVASQDDIPALEGLLSVREQGQQNWCLLVSYPSWDSRHDDAGRKDPHRHVWIHLHSYLVQTQELSIAYELLRRRNFFGRWMPEGATWLYGFAGEYPWGTAFNTEPEEWHRQGGYAGDLPVAYKPSWNELAVEWEYDASLPQNLYIRIPARTFFGPGDLWWNQRDGYRLDNGRPVFRDPSVTEAGPASLVADADDLLERLSRLDYRLVWTLLGEKLILGGPDRKPTPRRTFSQVAYWSEDGRLHTSERVFFDDYDQDTGPGPLKRKHKK